MKSICIAIQNGKFKDGKPYVCAVFPAVYKGEPIRIYMTEEFFKSRPLSVGDVADLYFSREKKKFVTYFTDKK